MMGNEIEIRDFSGVPGAVGSIRCWLVFEARLIGDRAVKSSLWLSFELLHILKELGNLSSAFGKVIGAQEGGHRDIC